MTVRLWAVGLVGLSMIKILAPGFFAHQNVATPVKIAVFAMVVTQLLNLVFVPQFAHAGLALSISVAALLNAALLLFGLIRRGTYQPHSGWWLFMLRIGAATAVLGALLWWLVPQYDWAALQASPFIRIGLVLSMVAGGALTYAVALLVFGLRPAMLLQKPATSAPEDADPKHSESNFPEQ